MVMPRFDHHQPATLKEALALLDRHRKSARILAGGTEIVPKMRAGRLPCEHLVSINRIRELAAIEPSGDGIRIGAGVRLTEVAEHPAVRETWPALAHATTVMATTQIRNMGTVAGNLANGSPCADTSSPLLAYGATVLLESLAGTRRLALDQFFVGPGAVALEPHELLEAIFVPRPPPRSGSAYLRLSARSKVDMAAVGVGGLLALGPDGRISAARLAMNAVAPIPLRASDAEALLLGEEPGPELFERASAACAAQARPITDVRATAEYRREMVRVLCRRVLEQCLARAGGNRQ